MVTSWKYSAGEQVLLSIQALLSSDNPEYDCPVTCKPFFTATLPSHEQQNKTQVQYIVYLALRSGGMNAVIACNRPGQIHHRVIALKMFAAFDYVPMAFIALDSYFINVALIVSY